VVLNGPVGDLPSCISDILGIFCLIGGLERQGAVLEEARCPMNRSASTAPGAGAGLGVRL
jgi:hypothetical protein